MAVDQQLGATADVHVYLQWPAVAATAAVPTLASDAPPSQWMAPKARRSYVEALGDRAVVSWPSVGGATSYDLYIDGALAKGARRHSVDTHALKADTTPCFGVVAAPVRCSHKPGHLLVGQRVPARFRASARTTSPARRGAA